MKGTLMRPLLLISLLLIASLAHAQTVPVVPAGFALKYDATHDGIATDGYRLYVDGAKVGADLPKSILGNGTLTVDVPAQPDGAHTIALGAFNVALGLEAKMAPQPFSASPGPAAVQGKGFRWTLTLSGTTNP